MFCGYSKEKVGRKRGKKGRGGGGKKGESGENENLPREKGIEKVIQAKSTA